MSIVLTAPVIPTPEPTGWQTFASADMNIFNATGHIVTMDDGTQLLNCDDSASTTGTNFTRIFDPVALTYSGKLAPSLQYALTRGIMSQISNGKILSAGGTRQSGLRRPQVYDRGTDSWSNTVNAPTTLDKYGLALADGGDRVFRFGGWITSSGNPTAQVSIYTTSTNTWTTGTNMPKSLIWPIAIPLEDGRILVGSGENSNNGSVSLNWWFLNTATQSYTETTPIPSGFWRKGIVGAIQLDNGTVYVAGGRSTNGGSGIIQTNNYTFNPKTEVWAAAAVNLPLARDNTRMNLTKLPDGRLVLHYDNNSYVSTNL